MEKINPKVKVILVLVCLLFIVATSCTTTRKTKKKCHDCPEFSLMENINPPSATFNGEV